MAVFSINTGKNCAFVISLRSMACYTGKNALLSSDLGEIWQCQYNTGKNCAFVIRLKEKLWQCSY